jgi:recombination protein RecA
VAPPFREALFDILYGTGISRTGEIIDLGVEAGIVEKSGSWFAFNGERLGQGKENVRALLDENPVLRAAVETKLVEHLGMNPGRIPSALQESEENGSVDE